MAVMLYLLTLSYATAHLNAGILGAMDEKNDRVREVGQAAAKHVPGRMQANLLQNPLHKLMLDILCI